MNAGCAKGRDSASRNRAVHLSICRSSTFLPLSCFHSLSRSLFHCRRCRSTVVGANLLSRHLLVGAPVSISPDFYRFAIYTSPLSDWVFIAYFEISIRC